jgi:hypothetical protein
MKRANECFKLEARGWSDWKQLRGLPLAAIPECLGVYEIAISKPLPRIKGTTTILYIGIGDENAL